MARTFTTVALSFPPEDIAKIKRRMKQLGHFNRSAYFRELFERDLKKAKPEKKPA